MEAEPIKTLIGLGQPLDLPPSPSCFEEALPDSGVREVDGADEEDGFSDNEADTRVELVPPIGELPDGVEPLPDAADVGKPFGEAELLPVNWDDDEATRPQLSLPNHPSEPPPTLPGSRLADSDAHAAPLPSSPFAPESESERRAGGLDPRLSGMLAGAGMGAATAIAFVAFFAWRSSPPASPLAMTDSSPGRALPIPALPADEVLPASEESAPAADGTPTLTEPEADEPSQRVMAPVKPSAPPSREGRAAGTESRAVSALPVTLEDEAQALGSPGMLRLTSLPPAHVVLDGRPVGMTPKLLPVAPGDHNVLFVHPELGRRTLSVRIESGGKSEALNRF